MKQRKQITGAILLVLGLVVATGVDVNVWQAPVAAAMLLVGAAWIQGYGVWQFVRHLFEDEKRGRYDTIRHRSGIKYNQAAIFVGTACLFIGTPKECEELTDDLWHRGVQAKQVELTGNEVFDVL